MLYMHQKQYTETQKFLQRVLMTVALLSEEKDVGLIRQ